MARYLYKPGWRIAPCEGETSAGAREGGVRAWAAVLRNHVMSILFIGAVARRICMWALSRANSRAAARYPRVAAAVMSDKMSKTARGVSALAIINKASSRRVYVYL